MFRHWALYNIDPKTDHLIEGHGNREMGTTGVNDFRKRGYNGPAPPRGHGTHHYHFKLAALDVDLSAARTSPRCFARTCVDLTQRRSHIGGALGAALLDMYLARGWILRMRGSRAVSITPKGSQAFARMCA